MISLHFTSDVVNWMLFLFYFIFPQASNYRRNEKQFFNFFENVNHLTRSSNTLSLPDRHFLVRACKVLRCFPEYWCPPKKKKSFGDFYSAKEKVTKNVRKSNAAAFHSSIHPSLTVVNVNLKNEKEKKRNERFIATRFVCVSEWVCVWTLLLYFYHLRFPPTSFCMCAHI